MNGQVLLARCRNELSYALSKWKEGEPLTACIELLTRNLKSDGVSDLIVETYITILKEKAK